MADKRIIYIGDDPTDRTVDDNGATYTETDLGADMPATTIERRDAAKVFGRQARAAMNMWIAGAHFDEIAEKFEYASPVVARTVVEEAMAKAFPPEASKSMFDKTYARYEDLLRGVLPKARPKIPEVDPDTGQIVRRDGRTVMVDNPEHIPYVKLAADLIQREAKLFGIEAPVQVQITPGMEEFNTFVATVVSKAREAEAEEADIFAEVEDAEIVE